jgi:predicted PolB exonuclease-like 3'-5' exonuclease
MELGKVLFIFNNLLLLYLHSSMYISIKLFNNYALFITYSKYGHQGASCTLRLGHAITQDYEVVHL